jgi:hypothetical protein
VKSTHPHESRIVPTLQELSDCNGSQLLKGFGEIAFKVISETFAFTLSNSVSTKFNNLKSRQEPRTFHNTCCGDTLILGRCKTTHNQENRTTYQDPHAHASMFHMLPSFRCITRTSFCRAPFTRPFVLEGLSKPPKVRSLRASLLGARECHDPIRLPRLSRIE